VLYGDYAIVSALRTDCEDMENVCGNRKAVCLAETGHTFNTLKAANKNSYSLFLCEPNALRPSCTPARFKLYNGQQTLEDSDGDGVPDLRDNCPGIFNPARPMDNGRQVNICPKP
jgi:large repetitive protein